MGQHLGACKKESPVAGSLGLLLVAHGSGQYHDAASPALAHAEALRQTGAFAEVEVATLAASPTVAEALARISAPHVLCVPFFMEAGYFTRVAIPRAVGDDRRVRFCQPVGTHAAMSSIITRMAEQGCAALSLRPDQAAVLVVGHGSASAPGRDLALYDHVRRLGGFARAEAACLEETPLIADALAALRGWPVIIVGFFAGQGMHVRDDVPHAVAHESAARGADGPPVRFQGSVGDDPAMASIIRDRARECTTGGSD
jgi:sirohydrochlorin cobaltochelatase